MAKYRKKPIVVEAWRWLYNAEQESMPSWIEDALAKVWPEVGAIFYATPAVGDGLLRIQTLEGVMTAEQGDYIIQGIKGELYPCKPDIFEATYDEANATGMLLSIPVCPHFPGYPCSQKLVECSQGYKCLYVTRKEEGGL